EGCKAIARHSRPSSLARMHSRMGAFRYYERERGQIVQKNPQKHSKPPCPHRVLCVDEVYVGQEGRPLEAIVSAALCGDTDTFAPLVRRFQDMAVAYALSILGNYHDAEDVAQAAFLDAYRTLNQLENPTAFGAWLRKIVFKHCDRLRRRKKVRT